MIIFISDIHLDETEPEITSHFCQFLETLTTDTSEVYILGDLFEVWVGDDAITPYSKQIIEKLRQISNRGIKLYIQHGNRDFLLSKKFAEEAEAVLLQDEHIIEVANTRILLMHGDTLCENDHSYQKLRKWLRNPVIKFALSKLPLSIRQKMAGKLRNKSKLYNQTKSAEIMDVTQEAVIRVMNKHNTAILIHGHTHKQDTHVFYQNNKEFKRIVLPAWHKHASALILNESGKLSWQSIY